ncbi:hypothetical protein ACFVH7_22875 [Kitasatospora indigofera]|uniref:hypothetical protein n=1 Tax=Kitasatospora indigofera TaxID=67307 RepID=UPI00363D7CC6
MNKRIARTLATTVLAAGIVAVPAAGSAFAAGHGNRGSEQFYNHQVQAGTEHVYYSESTTYYAENDCDEYGGNGYGQQGGYGHQNGYYGGGILGLGLLGL